MPLPMLQASMQGYFYKAGALREQEWVTVADAAEVTIRGQVAQTLGMRLLFFFPVSVRTRLLLAVSFETSGCSRSSPWTMPMLNTTFSFPVLVHTIADTFALVAIGGASVGVAPLNAAAFTPGNVFDKVAER
jgi:hypothetical protein